MPEATTNVRVLTSASITHSTRPLPNSRPNTPMAHALSLRVLRLSRPTLSPQTTLPPTEQEEDLAIPASACLSYPSAKTLSSSPFTPVLVLPASFGPAYVGERFSCALCINHETPANDAAVTVTGVRVSAELQLPDQAQRIPIELRDVNGDEHDERASTPGKTLQKHMTYELQEEGTHVLAVTVTYTETEHAGDGGAPSGGRGRTFRKLYQFIAKPLIVVRTKVTEDKRKSSHEGSWWTLEAQLENVGEVSVVLGDVILDEADGVHCESRWPASKHQTVLKPQDIMQLMFTLRRATPRQSLDRGEDQHRPPDRVALAQMTVHWRGPMCAQGHMTTGWLTAKKA